MYYYLGFYGSHILLRTFCDSAKLVPVIQVGSTGRLQAQTLHWVRGWVGCPFSSSVQLSTWRHFHWCVNYTANHSVYPHLFNDVAVQQQLAWLPSVPPYLGGADSTSLHGCTPMEPQRPVRPSTVLLSPQCAITCSAFPHLCNIVRLRHYLTP